MMEQEREAVRKGRTSLGIELGSTRIKAVLIDEAHKPIAAGAFEWENQLENGIWTYSLEDAVRGVQESFQSLKEDVRKKYNIELQEIGAIGISGMQHGYLPFDRDGKLLTHFRTWRNTITGRASRELTELFQYPIPQRWSIAHLYQAILNGEEHLPRVSFMTTLAGYIHWRLTGEKVLGIGEASGMFPMELETKNYHPNMLNQFQELIQDRGFPWRLEEILPKVLVAGQEAGRLTEEGAKLLDVSGKLRPGIPFCPPEGDGDTGMVATNSIGLHRGNISAGTSVFAMVVLDKELKQVHPEIDLFATPEGNLAGQVHCNNCTSDLNAWVKLFGEFAEGLGIHADREKLFEALYRKALEGDPDCGGLLAYNYFSGEHITGFEEGRPLLVRSPESRFTLANFMRAHLFTALGAVKMGMDILLKEEGVHADEIVAHGGLFKTKEVGQRIVAAALNVPVTVMETAGEGGPWGMALLAAYMKSREDGESLETYLDRKVFGKEQGITIKPVTEDVKGFTAFMERYREGLAIERAAVENLK